ncbi:MAG: DUF4468 domain-containing protein [Bacteroidaceae bacterium]|nr:DUF4468 domain-containing protein [Bacteroidaceae bacterium]MEA4975731.1 DUF4468 domain-containing protein [Paludibacter sp.]
MKKIIFIVFISLIHSSIFAQERLLFDKVIRVDSALKKNEIYNSIKEWMGMNFVSAKNVIEVEDKDAGIIIASPLTDYDYGSLGYLCYSGQLKYTIKVQIKDGRFKVEVTNFIHDVNLGNSPYCKLGLITTAEEHTTKGMQKSYNNKVWADIKKKAELIAENYFTKFESINFSASSSKNADVW